METLERIDSDEAIRSKACQDVEEFGVDDLGTEFAKLWLQLCWYREYPVNRHALYVRMNALEDAIYEMDRNAADFIDNIREENGI